MPKRRQNGEGTIYQRKNGLWVCEITLGFDENNKRIKKTLTSMDPKTLQRKINEVKYAKDNQLLTLSTDYTVEEFAYLWLDTYKKGTIKPTSYDGYRFNVERRIIPLIGMIKLSKLNELIIQRMINKLSETLSLSSLKITFSCIHQICGYAQKLNFLIKNPCCNINLPKSEKKEARVFSIEEQERFIKTCDGKGIYDNLFKFSFLTGMRIGEILALTWNDVDLTEQTVKVNQTINYIKNYENEIPQMITAIGSPKSNTSIREIPLCNQAMKIVREQLKKRCSIFVFTNRKNTVINYKAVYQAFKNKLKKCNLPDSLSLHSARHAFATRLLESGADVKTVSELMGHSTVDITLNTYAHSSLELKRKTINLIGW